MPDYRIAVHFPDSAVVSHFSAFWFTSRLSSCKTVLKPVQGNIKRQACHCGQLMLMRYQEQG